MPLTPNREDLARSLDDAGGLRFLRATYLTRNQVVLTFDWQGEPVQFTAAVVEVLSATLPESPRSRARDERNPGVISQAVRRQPHWTEDELRAEGLPLYLSEDWLRAAHARLGSATAIERTYGYTNQAISRHLLRLGIETRPRNTEGQKEKVRWRLREGTMSYAAIAREAGVSKEGRDPPRPRGHLTPPLFIVYK